MGLSTAMYTGLSGMNANQTNINTIGHNIANVNTTAFKGSRTLFQTQLSQMLSAGNGPSENSGGVNPTQIGLGVTVGSTTANFNPGTIENTGLTSDLAIDGSGFFVLQRADGTQVYTRDGSFSLDAESRLVTADGHAVRGYGVDDNYAIQTGVLSDLTVPIGTLSRAEPTQNVVMDGDLSAAGTIATQGSQDTSQQLVDGSGNLATVSTSLSDLRSATAAGVTLLANGNTITIAGVDRGDHQLANQSFVIGTDGSTLGDFTDWLENALGIQDVDGVPGDPGVVIQNGSIVINSNAGQQNGFTINNTDITSDNASTAIPFSFTQNTAANGSSVTTSFTVYDSLGTPVLVSATMVMEEQSATGTTWRFYLESPESDLGDQALGSGTISFDTQGNVRDVTGAQVSIARTSQGAASPLTFAMDFTGIHGLSTQTSSVTMAEQDGYPPGTLSGYKIDTDGTINGTFSNGMTQTLGQVVVASIPNPEGMIPDGENIFLIGPNSGTAAIVQPGVYGTGAVLSGTLELSNVDLTTQFIGLITASTGFQASSRVISTSSDMLDQLLLIMR